MIQNVLAYLQREFKGVRVYIRATVSGHPNCKFAQGPYSNELYEQGPAWHNWCACGCSLQGAARPQCMVIQENSVHESPVHGLSGVLCFLMAPTWPSLASYFCILSAVWGRGTCYVPSCHASLPAIRSV